MLAMLAMLASNFCWRCMAIIISNKKLSLPVAHFSTSPLMYSRHHTYRISGVHPCSTFVTGELVNGCQPAETFNSILVFAYAVLFFVGSPG